MLPSPSNHNNNIKPSPRSVALYRDARAAEEAEVRENLGFFFLIEMHLQNSDGTAQSGLTIKYVVDAAGVVWYMRNSTYYLPHYANCSVSQLDFTFYDEAGVAHTLKLIDGYMLMVPLSDVLAIVTVRKVIGPPPPNITAV